MKFANLVAVATILSLAAIPVMAELTDYQKGVNDGLMNGLKIGYLLGGAQYNTNAAQQYSSMVNPFNSWLQSTFGANQTALNFFGMKPLSGQIVGGYQAYPTVTSSKPVHSIDGSWNQSTTTRYNPDITGKIYGYDPDTYYTMVGWNNAPTAPTYIDENGNKHYAEGSLQAP